MTLPSHILFGGVIAMFTGNPVVAIAISVLVDLDHLASYVRSGVIFSPKKFWKTVTDKNDPYGDQRGYLHNFFIAAIMCAVAWIILPEIGLTFSLAYMGHLLLDSLDRSDYWPLYPSKKINVKGFVDYFSAHEILFDVILIILLLILIF